MFHWKSSSIYAAIFGFKTRDPLRDDQTDEQRLKLLETTLHQVMSAVQREKEGLKARYEDAACGAVSLSIAEENAEGSNTCDQQINEMTRQLIAYQARIKRLSDLSHGLHGIKCNLKSMKNETAL